MASQMTSLTIVYSTVYSGADQRKHQSSTSPLCREFTGDQWQIASNAEKLPFDDVIMNYCQISQGQIRLGVSYTHIHIKPKLAHMCHITARKHILYRFFKKLYAIWLSFGSGRTDRKVNVMSMPQNWKLNYNERHIIGKSNQCVS